MRNERLRAAMSAAGTTNRALSEALAVDAKTVDRWVGTGRVPHRVHRAAVAKVLGCEPDYLWPEVDAGTGGGGVGGAEIAAVYANRGSVPMTTWTSLVDQAAGSIDLLAYAASFLHDAIADFDEVLARKAGDGVDVRLLFADPDADSVRVRGEEEGIGDLLAARCRLTWKYLRPVLDVAGVQARRHDRTVYSSVFRFDDDVLVNTHVFGAAASHAPVLHVRRAGDGRLFRSYLEGFERTWDSATPVTAADLP